MILITGASGFVGLQLVNVLAKQDRSIRCLVRRPLSDLPNNVEVVNGDIRDKSVVRTAVNGVRQIIHLAGVQQHYDYKVILETNVEGTRNLVTAAIEEKVSHFIFFSTLNVILPVKNVYSLSKLESENIVKSSGIPFTILRPSIIYGPYDRGTIGKIIDTVKNKRVVFLIGNGKYKIQPVFIQDVVKVICDITENFDNYKNKCFFLVGGDVVSYDELADLIFEITGVKCDKIYIPFSLVKLICLITPVSKKAKVFWEKLKTYPFNKTVTESHKNVLPLVPTPLSEGLQATVRFVPQNL